MNIRAYRTSVDRRRAVVQLRRFSCDAQLKPAYRQEEYDRVNYERCRFPGGDRPDVPATKVALIARGLLSANKTGATSITNDDKNALAALPPERAVRL